MNISDPRNDVEVMVENGVLTQKKRGETKKINLSDSLKFSWSEDTSFEHLCPETILLASSFPIMVVVLSLIFWDIGVAVPTSVVIMTGLFGLLGFSLVSYGLYRYKYPKYEFPEYGAVQIKSNGVKIDIYASEPEKLMNELS